MAVETKPQVLTCAICKVAITGLSGFRVCKPHRNAWLASAEHRRCATAFDDFVRRMLREIDLAASVAAATKGDSDDE